MLKKTNVEILKERLNRKLEILQLCMRAIIRYIIQNTVYSIELYNSKQFYIENLFAHAIHCKSILLLSKKITSIKTTLTLIDSTLNGILQTLTTL